ncbi:MAG: NAD(P)-binding domain-containing protein [Leptospirales bacterium]|jgi:cation diffusion facilitator CzcD-associated flavoprotein CzcO
MSENRTRNLFCIIGAGAAGLGAAKAFKQAGLNFDVFEDAGDVGGIWDASRDDSPVNRNTHVIASKATQQYPDFPMPDSYPDYPDHRLVLRYLRSYADQFGLREHINFNSKVSKIEPGDGRGWRVSLESGATKDYAGVVIATGHDRLPRMPEIKGDHGIEVLHSSRFKDVGQILNKRVLIVGAGQSAADLLCEAATNAETTYHSTRRGFFCMPKHMLGRPTDTWLQGKAPKFMRRFAFKSLFRILLLKSRSFGLPIPGIKKSLVIPILGDQLHHHYTHGDIVHKGDIERLEGNRVYFDDGSEAEVDVIFFATGFSPSYEFIDPRHLNWAPDAAKPALFLHIFPPETENLFVVGMVRPIGSHWDAYEHQGHLVASYIKARENAPARAERFDKLRKSRRQPDLQAGIRFYNAGEYPLVVEKQEYVKQVRRQIKALG